jgi:hypothetical protein
MTKILTKIALYIVKQQYIVANILVVYHIKKRSLYGKKQAPVRSLLPTVALTLKATLLAIK